MHFGDTRSTSLSSPAPAQVFRAEASWDGETLFVAVEGCSEYTLLESEEKAVGKTRVGEAETSG